MHIRFRTLIIFAILKRNFYFLWYNKGFRTLIIFAILKPLKYNSPVLISFRTLIIFAILKLLSIIENHSQVLELS